MDFLKINRISIDPESLDCFYSNAPFVWIVMGVVILILVVLSSTKVQQYLTYEEEKIAKKKKKKKRVFEFGLPIVCGTIVIAMTYHSNQLKMEPNESTLIWKDRHLLTFFTPETLRFDLTDIVGIRIDQHREQPSEHVDETSLPKSNFYVRLDLKNGSEVDIWAHSSRDRSQTEALAEQLIAFIENHPAFSNQKLYKTL